MHIPKEHNFGYKFNFDVKLVKGFKSAWEVI